MSKSSSSRNDPLYLVASEEVTPSVSERKQNGSFFDKQPGEFTGRLLLTIIEAAKLLGMSEKAVRMHIERENIRSCASVAEFFSAVKFWSLGSKAKSSIQGSGQFLLPGGN